MSDTVIISISAWLAFNFLVVLVLTLLGGRPRRTEPRALRHSRMLSAEAYVSILPSRLMVQASRILGASRTCLLVSDDDERLIVAAAHGTREDVIGVRTAIDGALLPSTNGVSRVDLSHVLPGTDLDQGIAILVRTSSGRVIGLCADAPNQGEAHEHGEHQLLTDLTALSAAAVEDADPRAGFERAVRSFTEALIVMEQPERSAIRPEQMNLTAIATSIGAQLGLDRSALIELQVAACIYQITALTRRAAVELEEAAADATWFSGPDPSEMARRVGHFPGFEVVALVTGLLGERWDGRGFPHGLRGERIPLVSRILAACGAVWTLTVSPPHGAGAPPEAALRSVQAASGAVFDPTVVMALSGELMGDVPRVADAAVSGWAQADALYSLVR